MKNWILFISLLITVFYFSVSKSYCTNSVGDSLKCRSVIDSSTRIKYYINVDSMPKYPGGEGEMLEFFCRHYHYPQGPDACCRITVEFIINEQGKMVNLMILKGLQEDFDNETLRVLRLMPT